MRYRNYKPDDSNVAILPVRCAVHYNILLFRFTEYNIIPIPPILPIFFLYKSYYLTEKNLPTTATFLL